MVQEKRFQFWVLEVSFGKNAHAHPHPTLSCRTNNPDSNMHLPFLSQGDKNIFCSEIDFPTFLQYLCQHKYQTLQSLKKIDMIPREINGQTIFSARRWSEIMDSVKEKWNKGFFITDFDYGDGVYVVVMSKVEGWNGQSVRFGSSLPTDEISELWDKGYYITNVMHDGSDWIVVMTGVDYCCAQSYFSLTDWSEFKEKITEGWEDDKIVTKLCCEIKSSYNRYFAVMTEFNDCSPSQSRRYISGHVLLQELADLCDDDKYIVDIFDFDGGAFVVSASETGWNSYKLCKCGSLRSLFDKVQESWDDGYSITTITYYNEEWLMVLGK